MDAPNSDFDQLGQTFENYKKHWVNSTEYERAFIKKQYERLNRSAPNDVIMAYLQWSTSPTPEKAYSTFFKVLATHLSQKSKDEMLFFVINMQKIDNDTVVGRAFMIEYAINKLLFFLYH